MDGLGARTCGFTVIQYTREQLPYEWDIYEPTSRGPQRIIVPVKVQTLKTGDYTIAGHEDRICIERKTVSDLTRTITHGRDRWVRELDRMAGMDWSCVLIEANWDAWLQYVSYQTQASPKALDSSILAWMQRYPKTHWVWRPNRKAAERTAWKVLDRWSRDHGEREGGNEVVQQMQGLEGEGEV